MPDNALQLGPLDRVLSLKTLPALEALGSRELVSIAQRARERFVSHGSLLFQKGAPTNAWYLVLDGRIELSHRGAVARVDKGGAIGLLELVAKGPFPSDARAAVDTLVLELSGEDQEDIWEDDFLILLEYLTYLARETLAELKSQSEVGEPESSLPMESTRALNLVERILALLRVPILSSKSIDAVAELSEHFTETHIERGETLWRTDDTAEHFSIVVSGRARLEAPGASRDIEVGPGACIGLEEALAGVPRWNDGWATEALSTLRISKEPFIDVLEDHFPLARHVAMTLAERLLALRSGTRHEMRGGAPRDRRTRLE